MAGRKYIPNNFDKRLGQIITLTRHRHGLSQKDLARHLGLTFQQIQKYESGANRISVRTLADIAKVFDMTIGELVDGASQPFLQDNTILQTLDIMYKLPASQRQMILTLARALAK